MSKSKSIKSNVIYEDGFFMGEKDIKIYYKSYEVEDSEEVIVISHGFCESSEKYRELIKTFNKNNYSVYIIDHRGHGKSGRLGIDNSQINVEDFNYYIKDLKTFLDSIVVPNLNDRKLYLFAHSMGGAIGALFLEKHNNYFEKAILNCPMMEIDTGKYPKIVSKIVSKLFCTIGMGNKYLFGHGPFNSKPDFINSATSSRKRYDSYFNKQLEHKELQTSGGSFNWLNQAFKGIKELLKEENISYTYDNEGNLIKKQSTAETTEYTYNLDGKLSLVKKTSGSTVTNESYSYNAFGTRIKKVTNGEEERYLVDEYTSYSRVLEEKNKNNNLTATYTYGHELISQNRATSVSFYNRDGLGSTTSLTNASQTVTDTYSYDAFGNLINSTGTTKNNYLFAGEEKDNTTGYYYLRARYSLLSKFH